MAAKRFTALIALVAVERVLELVVSKRNLQWSIAQGGKEFGAKHYPVMVALHSALLVGAVVEARRRRPSPVLGRIMVVVVLVAQALRWWCITTLGRQWNTRVVVVPGATRVVDGPYRVLPHPNYVAVVTEERRCRWPVVRGSPLWCSRWPTPRCCGPGSAWKMKRCKA